MDTVKTFVVKQFNDVTTNPINFAMNALGSAVAVWFAAVIINFAIRITMESYSIITSAF
jgi:hypothetical protein